MINLAVINIRDLIRITRKIFLIIVLFIFLIKIFPFVKKINVNSFSNKLNVNWILNNEIIIANYINNEDKNIRKSVGLKNILVSEFAMFNEEEKLMEIENQEEVLEFQNLDNMEKAAEENVRIQNIPNSLNTEVINQNNKNDVFTDVYKSVKIKNESSYELTEEILNPNVEFSNKKDIIIYHTHTCESYTKTDNSNYIASGNYRTTDLNFSVAKVRN